MSLGALFILVAAMTSKLAVGRSIQSPINGPTFIENSIFGSQYRSHVAIQEPTFHIEDEFTQDTPYEGIAFFAHLNGTNCFSPDSDGAFDIGIVGAPFDLGVTYRPGARFGPAGARMGARRLSPSMGYR